MWLLVYRHRRIFSQSEAGFRRSGLNPIHSLTPPYTQKHRDRLCFPVLPPSQSKLNSNHNLKLFFFPLLCGNVNNAGALPSSVNMQGVCRLEPRLSTDS